MENLKHFEIHDYLQTSSKTVFLGKINSDNVILIIHSISITKKDLEDSLKDFENTVIINNENSENRKME